MNSGSFFRLDLESSKVVEGITFYNYIDLPDLYAKKHEIRYPIRLSISSDSVSIFVHYFKEKAVPRHSDEVIINLPYTAKDGESLSSTIKHLYNSTFPLGNYLDALLKDRYNRETDKDSGYYQIQTSQINKDSYSSLSIWGLTERINSKKEITWFLRKLLLDFMFDLMHSDVFETSKYYAQMREGLMNDFFFSSIIKKSEYYYYRRIIRSRFSAISDEGVNLSIEHNSRNDSSKKVLDAIKNLYADKLNEAEAAWIDTIMSPMAEKHFAFSPEWYEDETPRKRNHSTFNISESWFVDTEEEMSRVVFPMPNTEENQSWWKKILSFLGLEIYAKDRKVHYLNSFELCKLIGSKDDSALADRNTKVSKWFYRRYDFRDTFRLHLFNGGYLIFFFVLAALFAISISSFPELNIEICPFGPKTVLGSSLWVLIFWGFIAMPVLPIYIALSKGRHVTSFLVLLLLIAILIVFDLNINKEFCRLSLTSIWDSQKWLAIFPAIALVLFLSTWAAFYVWRGKRNETLDEVLLRQRIKREARLACFLTIECALAAGFIFVEDVRWQLSLLLAIVLSLLGFVWVARKKHIINNVHLLLPRLVASITTGWIMLVIGNDIFKEHLLWPTWIVLALIVFTFILYENNKTLPKIGTWEKIRRALGLMLISYSMSLIIGIIAMNILPKDDVDCGCVEQSLPLSYDWNLLGSYEAFNITVFPEHLISFSFLAMFIGVFIQMIFEEKNMTEM